MKHNNIHIIWIPEAGESKQEIENLYKEIMAENFPNLVKETNTGKCIPGSAENMMNSKRSTHYNKNGHC